MFHEWESFQDFGSKILENMIVDFGAENIFWS